MVQADSLKMQRVFSNIVSNAMQAMAADGELWFETYERTDTQTIEFVIGNSGSCIAEQDIPHLFTAFFTKNKRSGTGLGLAIAQKIIRLHGGEIWCCSSEHDNCVEFHFTMPLAARHLNRTTAVLFANTGAILKQQGSEWKVYDEDDSHVVFGTMELEEKIAGIVARLGHKVRLWFVEDEPLYRNALRQFVEGSERFAELIELSIFENSTGAIDMYKLQPCDVLICDIDLGEGSLDGFEVIRILRSSGFNGPICVHSNRHDISELRKSWEVGGSTFIPKPMSKIHLLKFLACLDPV
jgi:CheY-like chemotaxis protein